MTRSLLPPDTRRQIAELTRRLEVLERRQRPADEGGDGDHAGGGSRSTQVRLAADPPNASGADSVAIGALANAATTGSTAVGADSEATGPQTTAYGWEASATGDYSVALGGGSLSSGDDSFAAGTGCIASGLRSTAVGGGGAGAAGTDSTAVGNAAVAGATDSAAFGAGAGSYAPNQIMLGNATTFLSSAGADGLVVRSPDGTRWRITVDNAGALAVAAA